MILVILAFAPFILASAPYSWTWWGGSPNISLASWPPFKGVNVDNKGMGYRSGSGLFVDDYLGCAFLFGGYTNGGNFYTVDFKP